MHPLRLAYSTLFVISLVAFFMLWGEVGGSAHLDLMPWYLKAGLGGAAAFSFVRATAAAVARPQAWNGLTLRWSGILLSLLIACGVVTYYYHLYYEEADVESENAVTEVRLGGGPCMQRGAAEMTRRTGEGNCHRRDAETQSLES